MAHIIKIAGIVEDSIVDGPGLRLVIFTQGCLHKCPGCHNPETHDPAGGRTCRIEEILERYEQNPLLDGVTFSGGEPFLQAIPLAQLAAMIHSLGGTVLTYTGYIFEELVCGANAPIGACQLLEETDLLVDGPYVEALRSLELEYRGSSNQRLLSREAREQLLKGLPSEIALQMQNKLAARTPYR